MKKDGLRSKAEGLKKPYTLHLESYFSTKGGCFMKTRMSLEEAKKRAVDLMHKGYH